MAEIINRVMSEDEVSFEIAVDLPEDMPEADKNGVLADIGDFVKNSMLDYIGEGKSPLASGEWKRSLSKPYKKLKAGESGKDFANLELHGDLLDAFDFEITDNAVRFFIAGDQAVKAYAHNTGYEGHPTIPNGEYKREFIPKDDQTLKSSIMKGIDSIINEAIDASER